jgi:hypothetical protein
MNDAPLIFGRVQDLQHIRMCIPIVNDDGEVYLKGQFELPTEDLLLLGVMGVVSEEVKPDFTPGNDTVMGREPF